MTPGGRHVTGNSMYLLSTPKLLTFVMSTCLMAAQVRCHTHSQGHARTLSDLATEDHHRPQQQQQQAQPKPSQQGGEAGGEERRGGCEEGWMFTHHLCLLDTGLGSGEEAQVLCHRHGAQEARGICVKQSPVLPPSLPESSVEDEEGQGISLSSSSESQAPYVCPSGWTQYDDFCFFRPGTIPKICGLLGANYVFDYCVTRVPHQVSTDFMKAIKRLDGADYDMHRDTRMCCCGGHQSICK